MPIYAFQCELCGRTFDVRATIEERRQGLDPECPQCQAHQTHQVITSGVILHGVSSDSRHSAPTPACGCGGSGCCG